MRRTDLSAKGNDASRAIFFLIFASSVIPSEVEGPRKQPMTE